MTTQAAQARPKVLNKAWFYFLLCFAVFGTMTGVMMVPALLVEIARDMDVSVAVAGQLATATFAAWAASIVAVGPLADSIGRRPLALAGVSCVVVSLVCSAFAPNIETLMGLRILAGLGGGAIAPTSIGVISDVISPARRAQAIGGLTSTIVLTSAVSIPLMAFFADLWGWRFSFVLAGVLLGTALILNLVWYPRDSRERVRGLVFFSRYWSLLSLNFFRLGVIVNTAQRMAYWSLLSFLRRIPDSDLRPQCGFRGPPAGDRSVGPGSRELHGGTPGDEELPCRRGGGDLRDRRRWRVPVFRFRSRAMAGSRHRYSGIGTA